MVWPRSLGWGLGPVSAEGWAVTAGAIVVAAGAPLLAPRLWWAEVPVVAVLLLIVFLKSTSPGGARAWEEFQSLKDQPDGQPEA